MKIPIYKPLNTLKKVAENIWIVDGETIEIDFILFDIPFSTRMTIVKLKNGTLWCHSPIQPSTDLLKEIRELGEVRHLISPNRFHYAYIDEWKKLFQMQLLGAVLVWKHGPNLRITLSNLITL